jgi:hypothetical protein
MIDFELALQYLYDLPCMPHAIETFEAARASLRCDARPAVGTQELAGDSAVSQVIAPG